MAKNKDKNIGDWGEIWELTDTQTPFVLDLVHDFCALGGGAGNGKTFSLNRKAILACELVPGIRVVICRETAGILEDITIPDFAEALLGENGSPGEMKFHIGVANWAKGAMLLQFKNGSTIKFLPIGEPEKGIREIEKQLSRNIGMVCIDQADRINFEVFTYLITRNRQKLINPATGKPLANQFNVTYNPSGYSHWLYQCFVRKNKDFVGELGDMYHTYEYSTHEAALLPEAVMEKYANLPQHMRDRFYHGIWGVQENAVYPEWKPSTHVVPQFNVPKGWDHYLVFDYGWSAPSCFLIFAVTRKCKETPDIPENIVFCIREHYKAYLKVYEHCQLVSHLMEGRNFVGLIADPSIWQAGPDGESIGDEYNKHGFYFERADNSQILGVERTQTMLQPLAENVDAVTEVLRTCGVPISLSILEKASKLMFLDGMCPQTIDEIPSQEYGKLAGMITGRSLLKQQKDHAADDVRYMCSHLMDMWTPEEEKPYSESYKYVRKRRKMDRSRRIA